MRSRAMTIVAALVTLAATPVAHGAWQAPQRASVGPLDAHSPVVSVNGGGDSAAAWVRGTGRAAMIVVSLRQAGGSWGEPQAISRRGRPAIDPQVAIDDGGLAVVTWRQVIRTRRVLTERGPRRQAVYVARARERRVTEPRWGTITTLSSARHKVGPARLGMDASGRAVAAWHWGTGTTPRAPRFVGEVQVTERRSDGSWTTPRRISTSSLCAQVRRPQVAVGGRGHAVVWWQCDLPDGTNTAVAVSRVPGQSLGSEVELPFRSDADVSAGLAVSDSGRASAVSAYADGTLRWWRGDVTERLRLQALPALGPTERSDARAGAPRVSADSSGDALTAWTDRRGRPRAAPVASDLGVGAPTSLGPPSDATGGVRVAVAGSGRRGVVSWITDRRVRAAARSAGGTLPPGTAISSSGVRASDPLAVGVDGAGNAAILWTRVIGSRSVVERAESPPS